MDFFSNPLSSPVGQRIEKATAENPGPDNLVLQLEICDIINETEEGAKDAVKALRKRLFGHAKWPVVLQALAVLEICVKNCGTRFHVLIAKKEVVDQLVALTTAKTNAPTIIQERVLGLIQVWADSFRGHLELEPVCGAYDELRRNGIDFPAQDLDTLAPIYTPHRSLPEIDPATTRSSAPILPATPEEPTHVDITTLNPASQAPATQPYPTIPAACPAQAPGYYQQQQPPQQQWQQQQQQPQYLQPTLQMAQQQPTQVALPARDSATSPTLVAKIRSELDIASQNAAVLSEMVDCFVPGQEATADYELFMALNAVCREMQTRTMHLLSTQIDDNLTGDLLNANDMLNAAFTSYDAYQAARRELLPETVVGSEEAAVDGMSVPGSDSASGVPSAVLPSQPPQQASLIDFGEESTPPLDSSQSAVGGSSTDDVTSQLGHLGIEPPSYRAMASIGSSTQATSTASADVNVDTSPKPEEQEFAMFAASRQAGFSQPNNAYEMPDQSAVSFSGALSRNPHSTSASAPPTSQPVPGYAPAPSQPWTSSSAAAVSATATDVSTTGTVPTESSTAATETENISQWLAANNLQPDIEVIDDKAVEDVEPMSTEEFDMFLSSRAPGSKKTTAAAAAAAEKEKKPARRARPMMKHDEDEHDGLFAL